MAGSDVVEAMQLALKPFHMQHLADDWAAQAGEKFFLPIEGFMTEKPPKKLRLRTPKKNSAGESRRMFLFPAIEGF